MVLHACRLVLQGRTKDLFGQGIHPHFTYDTKTGRNSLRSLGALNLPSRQDFPQRLFLMKFLIFVLETSASVWNRDMRGRPPELRAWNPPLLW